MWQKNAWSDNIQYEMIWVSAVVSWYIFYQSSNFVYIWPILCTGSSGSSYLIHHFAVALMVEYIPYFTSFSLWTSPSSSILPLSFLFANIFCSLLISPASCFHLILCFAGGHFGF
ncbi:hypothetical protein CRENBAI_002073 [Crenichthys baileyi]|uniref:TLC domain-containing protein n=1 Tax=Crenichthys baileyi TaxID=28760 RepID=A0AAV9RNP9_9TELE